VRHFGYRRLVIMMAVLLISDALPSRARVLEVTSTVPGSIQAAINAAQSGDVIQIAPGTYSEAINTLGKAMSLIGTGGSGATILDGSSLPGSVITCNQNEKQDTIIEGFTFTGGRGTLNGGQRIGGAIYCWHASPTIQECLFLQNGDEVTWAGAIFYYSALAQSLTLQRNAFVGNHARTNGGAIMVEGPCVIRDNFFQGNSTDSGDGAGIYVFAKPDIEVFDNRFCDNSAGDHGGGIYVNNLDLRHVNPSEIQVTNNLFVGNHSNTRLAFDCTGSAIHVQGGAHVIANTCLLNSGQNVGTTPAATICMVVPADGTLVARNLIAHNSGGGIALDPLARISPMQAELSDNILFNNQGVELFLAERISVTEQGNRYEDPLVCDVSTQTDGSVAAESPAFSLPGIVIGAVWRPGCSQTPVVPSTWSRIKSMLESSSNAH